jgi:tetratricopeptide (TPR) repeat protein
MYIHTLEASAHPERALVAAHRLAGQAMEPAAAHLIHMPSHIFLRVGDWASGIAANQHSIHHALDYRHSNQPAVAYACGHCQDFIRHADNMTGNLAGARGAAEELAKTLHDPTYLMGVLARFHQWDELLTQPEPPDENKPQQVNSHAARGFWHYSRGLALAATGRAARAEPELKALQAEAAQLPARFVVAPGKLGVGHEVEDMSRHADMENLALAEQVLRATLAAAQHRPGDAIALWRKAVELQDQMLYSEPPIWYYPVRESLGGALLRQHEAAQAEAVFKEDLRRNPNNPRSYFGLAAACKAQRKRKDAAEATAQFQNNWKFADSTLDLGSF